MPPAPRSMRLLRTVGRRLRWLALLQATFWSLAAIYLLYAAALLARRLTGVIPDLFTWSSFAAAGLFALAVGVLLHRRPSVRSTARAVDQAAGVKDLYLTLSLLDTAAGEYQPLVVQSAEEVAERIDPAAVAPVRVERRHWHVLWAPLAAACGLLFLPQLDPFGKVASAALAAQRKDRLAESRRQTALRLAEIRKQSEESTDDNPSDEAIEHLKLSLGKMEPTKKQDNFKTLSEDQMRLGEQWRKLASDKLKNLLKSAPQTDQQFGAEDQELLNKWTEELQQGSADGLQQELKNLENKLQRLAKTNDPIEQQQLRKEIKDRLKQLDKFAQQNLDAQELSASLQRAMKQLELAAQDDLSREALEAALESLELSELELEELAQSAEDLKKIEDALKTVQMAKKVNDKEKLDGQQTQGLKSMKEYQELYRKLLAEGRGEGNEREPGPGMGGPGIGKGGEAPENDDVKNDFQSEVARSAVQAGKILLSMKSKGLGEKGQAPQDYRGLMQQVKQGVSEAILQEQVPPGYHEAIKSYFDTLGPTDAPK